MQLRERKGLTPPSLIAVSLEEQILEEIPTEEHDKLVLAFKIHVFHSFNSILPVFLG